MIKNNKHLLFIFIYFFIFYIFLSIFRPIYNPDEVRYAQIAMEMLSTGQWIEPHFNGLLYFEKPILTYWFNSLFIGLGGLSNLSVRMTAILSSALMSFAVWRFANTYLGKQSAKYSLLVFVSSLYVVVQGSYSATDALFSAWVTLALVTLYPLLSNPSVKGYLTFGALCGLGFLTKGFIALALPFIVGIAAAIRSKAIGKMCTFGWFAILGALTVTLPWSIAIAIKNPDYWHYFFWVENIQRYFSEHNAQHPNPTWYFIPIVWAGLLPWSGFIVSTIRCSFKTKPSIRRPIEYLVFWSILIVIFFSLSNGKLSSYVFPAMPAFAMLLGHSISRFARMKQLPKDGIWFNLVLSILGLSYLIYEIAFGNDLIRSGHDQISASLMLLSFVFWIVITIFPFAPRTKIYALALSMTGLLMTASIAMPSAVAKDNINTVLFTKITPYLNENTEVFSTKDWVGAVNLTNKITHVNLLGNAGEFEYGLQNSNDGVKHLSINSFDTLITSSNHPRVIVILSNEEAEQFALPKADVTYSDGNLTLLVYQPHPKIIT
ncbi:glycosyltransferase family 39 protein [Vibrio sp. S4M6]|uniref:glycosyltransferase family 39 protein n=1 Tax=Vibrio sinus TaxID=2946865 RepID=UPI00202A4A98|nr:glycosyltransferase family 39 protein [Vibrio sinus]MCL9782492.1 glycosyltransferase family 39 protein [Vibrio sinus]